MNSGLKKTIIKALKINSLAHLRLSTAKKITPDATTIKHNFIAAEDHSTSNKMMSLSETPQALVKRMPIDQLMIGFLRGFVRMGVTYTNINKMLGFKSCLAGSPLTSVLGLLAIYIQGELKNGWSYQFY